MDLVFDSIVIYPDPAEKKAYGRIHVAEVSLQGRETIASIISGLASIPAERLLRPHKGQFELILGVCKDDFDQSNEICKQFGFDLDLLLREAGRIVRRQAPSIYRVAEALEKKNLLLYDEVLDLCPEAFEECATYLCEPPPNVPGPGSRWYALYFQSKLASPGPVLQHSELSAD